MKFCDECGTVIRHNKCRCGICIDSEQQPSWLKGLEDAGNFLFETEALPISMGHRKGWVGVIFKGSHEDSLKVKEFIKTEMKKDEK